MRNYGKETKYEDTRSQVKRREARNTARRKGIKSGRVRKGDNRELDHVGYHPTGSLARVRTVVATRHANRVRQPPHKGYGK